MTKKIAYICLSALLACACEQKESFKYEDQDALYFVLPKDQGEPWTEATPEGLEITQEFVTFKQIGADQTFWYPLYQADTLTSDTVKQVIVSVAGTQSGLSRDYRMKTVEADSSLPLIAIQYADAYSFSPNTTNDTISFVVLPPTTGNTSCGYVTFDTENSPLFPTTITGWDKLKVTSVFYGKPQEWNNDTYGPFSQEKYAFMVETLKTTYEYYSWITDENWQTTWGLPELRAALKAYNEAHKDAPKDFTFPGMDNN